MMRSAAPALLLIAPALLAAPVPKEVKAEVKPEGTWRLESLSAYGRPVETGVQQREHWTLAADGNVHVHTGPVPRPAGWRGHFELVFDPKAKTVDYHTTNGGNLNYPGVYELTADTLKICCNHKENKGVRPTTADAGPDVYIWTFQRVKPEGKK